MEELKLWLNKYGSTLTSDNLAEIRKVDYRTLKNMLKHEPNFPSMKGTVQLKVDTTNYYLWTLAEGNKFVYDKYKEKLLDGLIESRVLN